MSSGTPERKPKPVTPPTHLPPLRPPAPKPPVRPVLTPTSMPIQPPPVEHTLPALPSMLRPAAHTPTLPNVDGPTPPPLPAVFTDPATLPENPPPLPVAPLPPLSELQPWSAFSIGPAAAPPPPADDLDLSLDELDDLVPPPLPKSPPTEPVAEARPAAEAKSNPTMSDLGQVGTYMLKQLIGEGGMGLVYRAEDPLLKRPVALKIMKPEVAADDRAVKLFLTEAQATASIKDDRIAAIYHVGEHKRKLYIAMELLKGESLDSRMKRGPISLEQALWIVREAALGLKVAHNSGFVHRDIKPANLWLETAGAKPQVDQLQRHRHGEAGGGREWQYLRVKILDFGLVRLEQDSDGKRKTSVVGTPAYMAPEQAAGKDADHLADVFSLGVVLFRMLTGRLPFEGETPMEVLTALATKTAPLVSDYNPDVPKSLVELVQRMLSRDPMGRPNSMADVARWLEGIEKFVLTPPPPPKKRSKRTLLITIGVIAAMVVAGVGAVWWGLHGGESDDVPVVAVAQTNKVLTPAEAVNAIGDKVTVEFTVGAWKREDDLVYLYEQAPPKSDEIYFRVALPAHIVSEMRRKSGTPWPAALDGARLKVQGTVLREGRFAELLVSDVEQFDKIQYKERSEPAKPNAGEKDKSAAKSKPSNKPGELPGIGGDLPGTEGAKRREPDKQTSDELKDSVRKAARDMLKGFMDKDGQDKK
jgi:serine/threonine protein kinase